MPLREGSKIPAAPENAMNSSLIQLSGTLAAYVMVLLISYLIASINLFTGLLCAIGLGLVIVRLFIIQHDCAHRSYFGQARLNDRIGLSLGILTLVPHAYWRRMHIRHHASAGDLDNRGIGDIYTLTVDEYKARSWAGRLHYRLYRNSFVLLVLGPAIQFVATFRLPWIVDQNLRQERRSIWLTNFGVVIFYGLGFLMLDPMRFALIMAVAVQTSCSLGIGLFYVQHQVEHPYWDRHSKWSFQRAALEGSTYLVLPRWAEYLIGWINLHHAHHHKPNVPNYRLRQYMEQNALEEYGYRITLRDACRAFNLKLYDEARARMVGFNQI